VNYDQAASGKGPLSIAVFDAVTHIRGLQGTLGIAQVESDGETLKVTEMYSIANDSGSAQSRNSGRATLGFLSRLKQRWIRLR